MMQNGSENGREVGGRRGGKSAAHKQRCAAGGWLEQLIKRVARKTLQHATAVRLPTTPCAESGSRAGSAATGISRDLTRSQITRQITPDHIPVPTIENSAIRLMWSLDQLALGRPSPGRAPTSCSLGSSSSARGCSESRV
jgi:hypothetical protein